MEDFGLTPVERIVVDSWSNSDGEPAALTIPGVAQLPTDVIIKGPKYRVMFDRITVPNFTREYPDIVDALWGQPVFPFNTLPGQKEPAPSTMKAGDYNIEFFAYETLGEVIGNTAALKRIDLA